MPRKKPRQQMWNESTTKAAQKFSPTSSQARDEGPRLIPLPATDKHPTIERYLTLADIALKKR
jgi:hypothetical protein